MDIFFKFLGILGGASFVLTSLFAYFGKARIEALKADLASTNETLKAELTKSIHITRAKFDLELEIYKRLWAEIEPVRRYTYALRPMLDHVNSGETEQERIQRRLSEFAKVFNEASTSLEKNRPFIPRAIFQKFRDILKLCNIEAIEYQTLTPDNSDDYWKKAVSNQEELGGLIDGACEAIQNRLESASVIADVR